MKRLIFVRGNYHSEFHVFDMNSFLESFSLNLDIPVEDIQVFHPLTEEQEGLMVPLLAVKGNVFAYEGTKAVVKSSTETLLEIDLVLA